ncbi:MAG: hypothetical protein ABIY50_05105 [Ignavibacteria bacterium]
MSKIILTFFAALASFTIIIFLIRLLLRKNVNEIKFDRKKYANQVNEPDTKINIDKFLSSNNKMEAIKYLRETKKLSLSDAKNMIEKYAVNNSPEILNVYNNMRSDIEGDSELTNRVKTLISQGKKIEAIKLVVVSKKIRLNDAKVFVENLK